MLALILASAITSAPALPVASVHATWLATNENCDDPPGSRSSQEPTDPLAPRNV